MIHPKKIATIFSLAGFVLLGTAANTASEKKFKNLKVLPQDISEKQLDSVMHAFNAALKVSCDFCHAAQKNLFLTMPENKAIDFAEDNPMKENARSMMRMTIDINKTYFNFDSTKTPENITVISCNTCHRGNPFPAHE